MTIQLFDNIPADEIRAKLFKAVEKAHIILDAEDELIIMLQELDRSRYYIRFGYRSLFGFCHMGLKFTTTQSQRLVTQARRRPYSNYRFSLIPQDEVKDR